MHSIIVHRLDRRLKQVSKKQQATSKLKAAFLLENEGGHSQATFGCNGEAYRSVWVLPGGGASSAGTSPRIR
jgi:hypothetical protein